MSTKWEDLRRWTQARIGLGRSGHALSTKALLEFQWAHARARDAVQRPWDFAATGKLLAGEPTLVCHSRADSREAFLKRPDLGRRLRAEDQQLLAKQPDCDLVICVSDGLSAAAVETHFVPFWKVLSRELTSARYRRAPIVLVPFGRVAVSDEIGAALRAKLAVIILGERPGLTAADSLGVYLTYQPKPGNSDANRNCLSNVRPPDGLSYELATRKLLYLIAESLRRQVSGVALKEETLLQK